MSRRAARPLTVMAAAVTALTLAFTQAPIPAQAFTATSPNGIDVSKWQYTPTHGIDWEKVAADGKDFAIIKATDGRESLSRHFEADSRAAADAGLVIGAYHYGRPSGDPIKQANDFARALELQPKGAETLPPVLDMEVDEGLPAEKVIDWAQRFLDRVEEQTGEKPMIYTFRWFWTSQMGNTDKFKDYPLWLAAYQDTPPTDIPGGWDEVSVWQRSSTGRVDGILTNVDLNTFNGTESDLRAFAEGNLNAVGTGDAGAEAGALPNPTDAAEGAGAIIGSLDQLPGSSDAGTGPRTKPMTDSPQDRRVRDEAIKSIEDAIDDYRDGGPDGDAATNDEDRNDDGTAGKVVDHPTNQSGTTDDSGRVDDPSTADEPAIIGGSPVVTDELLEALLDIIGGTLSAGSSDSAYAGTGGKVDAEDIQTQEMALTRAQLPTADMVILAAAIQDLFGDLSAARAKDGQLPRSTERALADLTDTLTQMSSGHHAKDPHRAVTVSDVVAALKSVGR